MLGLVAAIAAALVGIVAGIVVGFWLRNSSAGADKARLDEAQALSQKEAAARAGFESLSAERERTIAQMSAELADVRGELQAKSAAEREHAARIATLEAELHAERQSMAEKLALLEAAKKTLADQFEALAGKILDEKSKSFSEGSQKELGTLLEPLKGQIKDFREKVEQAQKESLVGRTQLSEELKNLKTLNERLSTEAHTLSTALRQDTQKQGHWGEQILLQILENSGLRRGEHYTYQESHTVDGENGQARKQQTDVIVKLPEGRHLIIDSKVTLTAYQEYANAENDKDREDAVKRLLRSFRDHYTGLAERNYHRIAGIQSPDFVVLFAPIEPAFMLAIREDEALWNDAYQKGVLLAGPTTILFVVRIVENLWRQEQQQRNVQKVMERGEKLYDKFVGFVEDLETVGEKIGAASASYKEAFSKLTSGRENLVRQVEMLRELGLKPKKRLKAKIADEAGTDEPELFLAAEAEKEEN